MQGGLRSIFWEIAAFNIIISIKVKKMEIIISWIILAAAIFTAAYILPGVSIGGFVSALVTALVLGIVNALIKPILLFLTLPINILTLGLFTFVINALMVLLVAALVPSFKVKNFWWALLFSIVVTVVNMFLSAIFT